MINYKICSGPCGKNLPATSQYFYKQKTGKYGFNAKCKSCYKLYNIKNKKMKNNYYEKNKKKLLNYNSEYKKNNKIIIKNIEKRYYEKNKKNINMKQKEYYEKNKDKIKKRRKKYYIDNVINIKKRTKKYQKYKKNNDINFRLASILRTRLWWVLKNNHKSISTMELLGCSIEEFKQHLESQFQPDMNWDNYGKWHIDHIKPCCKFDLSKEDEQKLCFHYSNMQPLWADDNMRKGGKYEKLFSENN